MLADDLATTIAQIPGTDRATMDRALALCLVGLDDVVGAADAGRCVHEIAVAVSALLLADHPVVRAA